MNKIDELLEKTCYIIDFLPMQVPAEASGDYFEIENYLLNNYDRYGIKDKYIGTMLKVMCYYRISVQWGEWIDAPKPEQIVEIIDSIMDNHSGEVNIIVPEKNVLFQFGWDCLYISVFNPDEEMCKLLEQISFSEGLFFRKGV